MASKPLWGLFELVYFSTMADEMHEELRFIECIQGTIIANAQLVDTFPIPRQRLWDKQIEILC